MTVLTILVVTMAIEAIILLTIANKRPMSQQTRRYRKQLGIK